MVGSNALVVQRRQYKIRGFGTTAVVLIGSWSSDALVSLSTVFLWRHIASLLYILPEVPEESTGLVEVLLAWGQLNSSSRMMMNRHASLQASRSTPIL